MIILPRESVVMSVIYSTAVDTCAHVVSLERTEHGPFTRADAIPEYQWTLPNVLTAIDASEAKFADYVKKAESVDSARRTPTRNKRVLS